MPYDKDLFKKIKESIAKLDTALLQTNHNIEQASEALKKTTEEVEDNSISKDVSVDKFEAKSVKITPLDEDNKPIKNTNTWPVTNPVTNPIKQSFGVPYTNYIKNTYTWSYTDESSTIFFDGDLEFDNEKDFNEYQLIKQVTKLYMGPICPVGKPGYAWLDKDGHAFVWNKISTETSLDPEVYQWIKVNKQILEAFWKSKMEAANKWETPATWLKKPLTSEIKTSSKLPEPPSINWFDEISSEPIKYHNSWHDTSDNPWVVNSIQFPFDPGNTNIPAVALPKINNYKKQISKPANPTHGLLWINMKTGDGLVYSSANGWLKCSQSIIDEFFDKKEQKTVKKKSTDSLFFRTNCGSWHEIVDKDKIKKELYSSLNNECYWFHSTQSSEKQWGCGHDTKRIVPVFSFEEQKQKQDEILNNQNGGGGYVYIKNSDGWTDIPKKLTITVGKNKRHFHHNSSEKAWYICLTKEECISVKNGTVPEKVQHDFGYIFNGAIPYINQFSWTFPGTGKLPKINQSNEDLEEQLYYIVAKAEQKLKNAKQNNNNNKYIPPDAPPSTFSEYNSSDCDYTGYMQYFSMLDDYDYNFLKKKAIQVHKYLLWDMQLAILKKEKKKYNKCMKQFEELQDQWDNVEDHYLQNNKKNGYKKPFNKSISIYGYLVNSDYGIPED